MAKVIKVGGAILNDEKKYANIMRFLWGQVSYGEHIVLVVSALGRAGDPYSTDTLNNSIKNALTIRERDRLKAIGETYAVLKTVADLRKIRLRCRSFSYRELGLIIEGPKVSFRNKNLRSLVESNDILVVPGYIGKTVEEEPATLKREGSDFSAVILAQNLALSDVYLFKDMPGIYDKEGSLFRDLSYDDYKNVVANFSSPISSEAVDYANKHHITVFCLNTDGFEVCAIRPNRK